MPRDYLTTGQVSRAWGVSLVTINQWIKQGKLRTIRTLGGHNRIPAEEFERLRTMYGLPSDHAERCRILVVDDDPRMLQFVLEILRKIRPAPKLEGAHDGYEGLLRAGAFRPDLLVLDLRMPGMDGFEVCRRIKGDPTTSGMKILALTGFPREFTQEKAFQCGVDAFLAKPFAIRDLVRHVKHLLQQVVGQFDS